VWAVLGGEDSWSTLKAVMDQLEAANQSPQEFRTPPNFRIIVNVNQLVEMATIADTAGKKAREAKEQAAGAEAAAKVALASPQVPAEAGANGNRGLVIKGDNPRDARRAAFARRQEQGGKIFRDSLAEGDDRIEIDSRLTETGARVRIRLEEGFVKIFGRILASRFAPANETPADEIGENRN